MVRCQIRGPAKVLFLRMQSDILRMFEAVRISPKWWTQSSMERSPFESYVLDSSVLIAFYAKNDSMHAEAVVLIQDIGLARILLHPFVVQETVTVLTRKAGLDMARQFIDDIFKSENVQLIHHDIESELEVFKATGTKMSLTDIALANTAQIRDAVLVTFDKELMRFIAARGKSE